MLAEPGPLRRYEVSPYVEFGLFQLSDSIAVGAPLAFDSPGTRLFEGGEGGVLFGSAGNDFYPTVWLELWAGEPLPVQDGWDRVEESDFDSNEGRLQFSSVNAAPTGEEIVLPGPGTYQIRVHCRGREEAAARRGRSEYLNYRGVEEWLVQLWRSAEH